jgi:hypothetical protein
MKAEVSRTFWPVWDHCFKELKKEILALAFAANRPGNVFQVNDSKYCICTKKI